MRFRAILTGVPALTWCGLAAMTAFAAGTEGSPSKGAPARPGALPTSRPAAKPAEGATLTPQDREFFEKEVRPLLAAECYSCHGEKVQQAGLRVDGRGFLVKGGDKGPALNLKAPEKSLLLTAVHHQGGLKMPPGRKLPAKQIAALEKWVRMGAPWPSGETAHAKLPATWADALRERRVWWSLQPVKTPSVPRVKAAGWSAQPVDRFVLAALEKRGIAPGPKADRRTLIRRLALLLTGLPPAPEEIEAFANDRDPKAYEKLVDRYLASPHYGETWSRHWMDVVRFNETHGYEWNHEIRDAWRYRDYLTRAFNQDLPYDQLIREHIAGDLLAKPRMNREERINESEIATAYYRFGEVGHDVFKEIGLDHLDNMIDTTSKAFQATTISCARCHDHKLDAVSQKDYYALLGIIASSRQVIHTVDDDTANASQKARLRELKDQIRGELAGLWKKDAPETGRYLRAAQAARDKAPNAAELATGLDAKRLQAWTTLLEAADKKKPGIEEPLFAWVTSATAAREGKDVAAAWTALQAQYEKESAERAESNRKNFTLWGDFRKSLPDGWRADGLGFREGPVAPGEFSVAGEGEQALTGVFPAGFFSHALSEKLNGSIQSPHVPGRKFVSMEVMGGLNGSARVVPDFRLLQDGSSLKAGPLSWTVKRQDQREERAYVEIATKGDNIRYPGWGGGDKGEALKDPRSYVGVTRIYLSDQGGAPKDELSDLRPLFKEAASSLDGVAARYADVISRAVDAWSERKATDDDARWLDWLVRGSLLTNAHKASPRLAELVGQYRAVEKELQPARVVAGMADLDSFDHPLYVRGDYRNAGEMVQRRYLEVLSSSQGTPPMTGSGRLELAERIASPTNPLTARVMANRIWHYLFGTGIVRTTDDFGHMGEKPSHPELLDYLATQLVRDGWSVKRMIRSLVLTETFQQTGQANARAREVDPENRLLHHYPARRLDAEAIRDSILAVSGRLDRTLFGESIQPYRVEPMPERRLFPGPLDGNGRRSVYTKITLMQGPAFLEVFNFPDPKTAMGRRDVTNVPAQALTLMNDPFVIQQAEVWADRLIKETDASVAARIDRMFRTAVSRPARPAEIARVEKTVAELASLEQVAPGEVLKNKAVWKDIAHAVFNLKEFIYVR